MIPPGPAEVRGPEVDPVRSVVERAHRDAEQAFELALGSLDPSVDRLDGSTTEPMLDRRLAILQAHRTNGWVATWPAGSVHRDEVVGYALIDPATAELDVCAIDDSVIAALATGRVVNDEVGIHRQRHEFHLVAGTWMLAARSTLASGDAAGCFR